MSYFAMGIHLNGTLTVVLDDDTPLTCLLAVLSGDLHLRGDGLHHTNDVHSVPSRSLLQLRNLAELFQQQTGLSVRWAMQLMKTHEAQQQQQ
jgi:hypothetical protein